MADSRFVIRGFESYDGRRVLDLADSANLYLTPEQGHLYEKVLKDKEYRRNVVLPLARGEKSLATFLSLARNEGVLDSPLVVLDFGPGASTDTTRHLRYLPSLTRVERYAIVDVNTTLLAEGGEAALNLGLSVQLIPRRFEDLERSELTKEASLFALFGGTMMNYEEAGVVRLFQQFAAPGDLIFLQTLLSVSDAVEVGESYSSQVVEEFVAFPLRFLGLERNAFEYRMSRRQQEFRFEFTAKRNLCFAPGPHGELTEGDLVLTAFSRRPFRGDFESLVTRVSSWREIEVNEYSGQSVASALLVLR